MNKQYPVGKAQQTVLDALKMTATGSSDADSKFAEIGIVVSAKRDGRTSVPSITILPRQIGPDAVDFYRKLTIAEFEAIKPWVAGNVPSDAVERSDTKTSNEMRRIEEKLSSIFDKVDAVHHSLGTSDPHFQDLDQARNELMSLISSIRVQSFFSMMRRQ